MSLSVPNVGLNSSSPAFKSKIVKGSNLAKLKEHNGQRAMDATVALGVLALLAFLGVGICGLVSSVVKSVSSYKASVEAESPKAEQNVNAAPYYQE